MTLLTRSQCASVWASAPTLVLPCEHFWHTSTLCGSARAPVLPVGCHASVTRTHVDEWKHTRRVSGEHTATAYKRTASASAPNAGSNEHEHLFTLPAPGNSGAHALHGQSCTVPCTVPIVHNVAVKRCGTYCVARSLSQRSASHCACSSHLVPESTPSHVGGSVHYTELNSVLLKRSDVAPCVYSCCLRRTPHSLRCTHTSTVVLCRRQQAGGVSLCPW